MAAGNSRSTWRTPGLDVLYLGLFAFLRGRADRRLAGRAHRRGLRCDLWRCTAIMMGLHECVSFPLAWFSGYVIEHRFGLSRQTFGQWLARHAKRFSLAVGFGAVMVYCAVLRCSGSSAPGGGRPRRSGSSWSAWCSGNLRRC